MLRASGRVLTAVLCHCCVVDTVVVLVLVLVLTSSTSSASSSTSSIDGDKIINGSVRSEKEAVPAWCAIPFEGETAAVSESLVLTVRLAPCDILMLSLIHI